MNHLNPQFEWPNCEKPQKGQKNVQCEVLLVLLWKLREEGVFWGLHRAYHFQKVPQFITCCTPERFIVNFPSKSTKMDEMSDNTKIAILGSLMALTLFSNICSILALIRRKGSSGGKLTRMYFFLLHLFIGKTFWNYLCRYFLEFKKPLVMGQTMLEIRYSILQS